MRPRYSFLITFFLFCVSFLTTNLSIAQCNYFLRLSDSFGDGWNNNEIDVRVASITTTYTLGNGFDTTINISVNTGDSLILDYVGGGTFNTEVSFELFNADIVSIYASNLDPLTGVAYADTTFCPSCLVPSPLFVSGITTSSVDLDWTENNGATQWQVEYDTAGFPLGTGNRSTISSKPYNVSGLNGATNYQWYVRSICGSGDTSAWTSALFLTECPIFTANYAMDFDIVGTVPCWNVSGNSANSINLATTTDHGASIPTAPFAVELNDGDWSMGDTAILITPPFQDLASGRNRIRFQAAFESTDPAQVNLYVGLIGDLAIPSTFVPIDTIDANDLGGVTDFGEIVIDLDDVALIGSNQRIAFAHGNGAFEAYIDNFVYEPIPCSYQLILQDVFGDGWENGEIEVQSGTNTFTYTLDNGFDTLINVSVGTGDSLILNYLGGSNTNSEVSYVLLDADGVPIYLSGLDPSAGIAFSDTAFCPSCPAPRQLLDNNFTLSSADLDWTEVSGATSWEIEYDTAGFTLGAGNRTIVNSKPFTLSSLNSATVYQWRVRGICGAGDTSAWSLTSRFATLCNSFTADYRNDFDHPSGVVACWNSYQNFAGRILLVDSTDHGAIIPTPINAVEINDGNLNNNDTAIAVSPAFTDLSSGKNRIIFQAAFESAMPQDVSLIIGVADQTSTAGNFTAIDTLDANDFGGSTDFNEVIIDLDNTTLIGNAQHVVFVHGPGAFEAYIDSFIYEAIPIPCPTPDSLLSSNISHDTVDLSWAEMGTAVTWQISYGASNFTAGAGTQVIVNINNPFVLKGLTATTDYDWYVRAICAVGDTSLWSNVASFTTLPMPCPMPSALSSSNISQDTVDLSWMENGTAVAWQISYGTSNFTVGAGTQIVVNTNNPYILKGLTAATDYDWYVRAICAVGDTSLWSNAASFTTLMPPPCNIPSALSSSGVSHDTASLSWTENGTSTEWEISYGISGFIAGNGMQMVVNNKPFTINGLTASTNYDWYVRSICGPGDTSVWSVSSTFTTLVTPLPFYPIGEINGEDGINGIADSLGVNCWTSGTVIGVDLTGGSGLSFYITDQSSGVQEGINVFSFSDINNYSVTEGDSISVRGEIIQINGLTEINIDSIELISTGRTLPNPLLVSNLDESTEAKWIEINDFSLLTGSGNGSFNMTATNGTDTLTIRVDEDTDVNDSLSAMALVPGDTICSLIGVGSQLDFSSPFSDDYRVFPMRFSDITICRLLVGIDEVDNKRSITYLDIYPNPTKGNFLIRSNGFTNSNVRIQIRDLNGKIIKNELISGADQPLLREFNIKPYAKGLYLISIYDGKNIIHKKLIVQ